MELSKYIACICEGSAERSVIKLLLDNNQLIFTWDDLLEGDILRCRNAEKFEEKYLRKGFTEKITVLRILDSRRENFKLSKAYAGKIKVINVITAPEIEMLVIFAEGRYEEYKKSKKKPSIFCKEDLKLSDVKSSKFVESYFSNVEDLVSAIYKYRQVSDIKKGENVLADLIKQKVKN
jgi:hypothetical protein